MEQETKGNRKLHRSYYAVDLVKFIMAILVVAAHTRPLIATESLHYKIYEIFLYLTVPFFFISTGYLLSEKCESEEKVTVVLIQHTFKLIKLYIIWSIVYFPLALCGYFGRERSILHYTLDYIRGFFIVGEHYNSWMLWYLLSSIYALIFVIILKEKGKSNKFILFIGCFIGACACVLTLYANNIVEISGLFLKRLFDFLIKIFVNGRIFTGFFYIPLGMYLYDRRKIKLSIGVILFLGGLILEIRSPGIGFLYEIGRGLTSIGIFSLTIDLEFKDSTVYSKLRSMSTAIYFNHLWIWTIVYTLIYHEKTWGIVPFFLTMLFSLIVGYLKIKYTSIKRKRNCC